MWAVDASQSQLVEELTPPSELNVSHNGKEYTFQTSDATAIGNWEEYRNEFDRRTYFLYRLKVGQQSFLLAECIDLCADELNFDSECARGWGCGFVTRREAYLYCVENNLLVPEDLREEFDGGDLSTVVVDRPQYDGQTDTVRFRGHAKRLHSLATNVRVVVTAFQEESWASSIDSPVMEDKIKDTIASLNSTLPFLHFARHGTSITWSPKPSQR
jgi:hypothetical protein